MARTAKEAKKRRAMARVRYWARKGLWYPWCGMPESSGSARIVRPATFSAGSPDGRGVLVPTIRRIAQGYV